MFINESNQIIDKFLTEQGYQNAVVESAEARYWYKRLAGTDRHQVVVREWKLPYRHGVYFSYEVEITFETDLGIWATNKFYSVGVDDLQKTLIQLESRLGESILKMGANPTHYRFDGED